MKFFNIGKGKRITTFHAYKNELAQNYELEVDTVVIDGNLITSQAPGTAFEFALEIVGMVIGEEKMKSVGESLGCC